MRPWAAVVMCVGCTGEILVTPPRQAPCGEPTRLVRLDATQYRAAVSPLVPDWPRLSSLTFPFSQARRSDLFTSWSGGTPIDEYDLDDLFGVADAIATEWVARQRELCSTGAPSCVKTVWAPVLASLWSRPPTDAELEAIAQRLADSSDGLAPKQAAVAALRAALMSPDLVFRPELGVDGRLTSYEVAAALSYSLWNRPPDDQALAAAAADQLTTTDEVAAEASRLLATPAQVPGLRRFLREWLQHDQANVVFKDPASFPFHRPNDLSDDSERVIERLIDEHARDGLHRALLTSDLIYVRPSTAKSWGVTLSADAGTFLHDPTRAGVLTHPSWLVAMSEPDHNHLVRRGRFIRERLLCGEVPKLPGGVVPQIEKTPGLTLRQRIERHSSDPACAGCHQLMDPLGMGFEQWDHLGRAQTMDNGGAIVTTGTLDGVGEGDGPYSDARELMTRLADAPAVRACWVKQLFRAVRGREAGAGDRCELARLTSLYEEHEDTVAVLEALFASDAFLSRTPEAP